MPNAKSHKQITVFSGAVLRNGKILMSQRDEIECDGAHLKWELPGGKAEPGESAEEAVLREIYEETGVKVNINKLIPAIHTRHWDYEWGKQQTFVLYFLCDFISEEKVPLDHHISSIDWFPPEEALLLDSLPGTDEIIQHIMELQAKNADA